MRRSRSTNGYGCSVKGRGGRRLVRYIVLVLALLAVTQAAKMAGALHHEVTINYRVPEGAFVVEVPNPVSPSWTFVARRVEPAGLFSRRRISKPVSKTPESAIANNRPQAITLLAHKFALLTCARLDFSKPTMTAQSSNARNRPKN